MSGQKHRDIRKEQKVVQFESLVMIGVDNASNLRRKETGTKQFSRSSLPIMANLFMVE